MHLLLAIPPQSTYLDSVTGSVSLAMVPHFGTTQQGKTLVTRLRNSKQFPLSSI